MNAKYLNSRIKCIISYGIVPADSHPLLTLSLKSNVDSLGVFFKFIYDIYKRSFCFVIFIESLKQTVIFASGISKNTTREEY